MQKDVINFQNKFKKITEYYTPKIVAQMNDYHFKLGRLKGDFVWHSHEETDEVFMVLEGELRIEFREVSVTIRAGEMYVVPRGVEHKPCADDECKLLLIEPAGTINTGATMNEMTKPNDEWV